MGLGFGFGFGIGLSPSGTLSEQKLAYGVERDITTRTKLWTRVDPAALGKTLPIQALIRRYIENFDGSFAYWLYPNDSTKKLDGSAADLSGATGNVRLYVPGFYRKETLVGNKLKRMYSLYHIPGFIYIPPFSIDPWFGTYDNIVNRAACVSSLQWNADGTIMRDGTTDLPVFTANAAQFRGGSNNATLDGTYRSHIGMARTSVSQADVSNKCSSLGTHIGIYRKMVILAELYTLEYANNDIQEAYNPVLTANGYRQGGLGNGPAVADTEWNTHNGYNPFVPNGVTAKLGNKSGVVNYKIKNWANTGVDKTVSCTSWRGFENWYQYLWTFCRDAWVYKQTAGEGGKNLLYECIDTSMLAAPASDALPAVPIGYNLISNQLPLTSGYGLSEILSGNGEILPANNNGSPVEGLCDYYWTNTDTGWFMILLTGSSNRGASCGLRHAVTYYRPASAYAHVGFRQSRNNPPVG